LEALEEKWNERPWHQEGNRSADWVLLDYVDFVVHIFLEEKREYYNLERLWGEAPQIDVPDVEPVVEAYETDDVEYEEELDDFELDEERLVFAPTDDAEYDELEELAPDEEDLIFAPNDDEE
jgi:hypothetical protein